MDVVTLTYGIPGFRNLADFEEFLDSAWKDPDFVRRAEAAGIDWKQIPQDRSEVVSIRRNGAALDPVITGAIIAIAVPLGKEVAVDLWKKVVLPWIEQHRGRNAVAERKD